MKIGNSPYAAMLPFLRGPAGPPGIPGEKGEKGNTGLLAFDHKLLLMLFSKFIVTHSFGYLLLLFSSLFDELGTPFTSYLVLVRFTVVCCKLLINENFRYHHHHHHVIIVLFRPLRGLGLTLGSVDCLLVV